MGSYCGSALAAVRAVAQTYAGASFRCTWSSAPKSCGVCETKAPGWCSESAAQCDRCGPTAFYCPAASAAQRAFLAPVKRHALHGAPVLIQSEHALSREGSASGSSGTLHDSEL